MIKYLRDFGIVSFVEAKLRIIQARKQVVRIHLHTFEGNRFRFGDLPDPGIGYCQIVVYLWYMGILLL